MFNALPDGNPDYSRIAIDASIIAGALIFLTLSSVGIIIPSSMVSPKTHTDLLYKCFSAAAAFVIMTPFSIDALGALDRNNNRKGMAIGFIIVPLTVGILALLYLFAALNLIPNT